VAWTWPALAALLPALVAGAVLWPAVVAVAATLGRLGRDRVAYPAWRAWWVRARQPTPTEISSVQFERALPVPPSKEAQPGDASELPPVPPSDAPPWIALTAQGRLVRDADDPDAYGPVAWSLATEAEPVEGEPTRADLAATIRSCDAIEARAHMRGDAYVLSVRNRDVDVVIVKLGPTPRRERGVQSREVALRVAALLAGDMAQTVRGDKT
jgi:hypothetical protein